MKRYLFKLSKKIVYTAIFIFFLLPASSLSARGIYQDTTGRQYGDTLHHVIPSNQLPEVIPVLYAGQTKSRLVQSVSYLNGKKLESSPVTLLSNAFAGQLSGLYSAQTNGAPRYDNPTLSLRGRAPLIVIDGVPRFNLVNADNNQSLYDVLSINPEQVESITLLKDALSTAMLGNRAMNGVLLVTTRNKGAATGSSISVTAQAGVRTPIGLRKSLSAFDYASLYNEAAVNSGLSPAYTQTQLDGYKNGTDAFLYPNVDYTNAVLRKNAPVQRYNISAGGSYTNVSYFLSLDYQSQSGLLRQPEDSVEQTNVDYKRYIIRSNINLKIDKHLSAGFNLQANIQDYYQPGAGYAAVFTSLLTTPNNAAPVYNANGSFGGSQLYPTNPYAQSIGTGHLQDNLQTAYVDVNLRRNMDDVMKGLWMKALLSYNPSYDQQIDRSRTYNAYSNDATALRVSTITDRLNASSVIERFQQTYIELSAGIDRNWKKNAVTGLVLAHYDNSQGDNTLNQIYKTASARLAYSFDDRYNLEAAAAYSSNNRFAPGKQGDFFPAAGISWNIHKEAFFEGVNFLSQLKLRASYGKVGNANPGYYVFNQTYTAGPAYFFGTGATSTASIFKGNLANPDRVTEKAKKLNVGLDLGYSHQRGWLSIDYFNNRQYDLLQTRGSNSALLGQTYPDQNIGKNRYYGMEISTGWSDHVGSLTYSISGNLSTIGSEVLFNDEPAMAYPYLSRVGSPINQIRGYVFDGLYNTNNLTAATFSGFKPSVGDAKYKDLNGDGVINQFDQTVIGNKDPLLFYGGNLGLQCKGFDLNVLVQGVTNRDIQTTGNYAFPFSGTNNKGAAFAYNMNRYTATTAATASLPRLTLGTDINNYITNSSLFIQNGSYVRLKNVELGYSFRAKFLAAAKIKSIRLFVNGQNLATHSKYKDADPEDYTGLYPIQRTINGGLSVKL